MALDVLRHRLVLSFEALSDDVTSDADPAPRSSIGCPSRSSRCEPMTASASAPERILQRLDWTVVRRLDGLLQGDYRSLFRGQRRRLRRPARVRVRRRRPPHRLERHGPDGHAVHPRVPRGPRDHGLVPARPQPVGRLRDGRVRAAEAERAGRLRDDAGPGADAAWQPGRGGVLRRRGSSGRSRRAAAGSRCCGSSTTSQTHPRPAIGAVHRPDAAARGGPALDQGSLARVRDLGLHQRAGLGAGAGGADPEARGHRGPAVRPARDRAARRRADAHRRRRDRASSCTSTRTIRRSGGGSGGGASGARRSLQAAFRRAGVDAVVAGDRRRPARRRSSGWPRGGSGSKH